MQNFYTYIYLDPRRLGRWTLRCGVTLLYEPFYVGKGKAKRLMAHLTSKQNTLKMGKIKRIQAEGYQPVIIKIGEDLDEAGALLLESQAILDIGTKWTISGVRRGPLTNMTSGGEGWSLAEETKTKLSKLNSGSNNPMFGRHRTEEEKQRLREFRKTFTHSTATREEMSRNRSNGNNSNAKRWIIIHPDGKTERVFHLKGWCEGKGISYNTLFQTSKKGTPISRGPGKGYRVIEEGFLSSI